MFTMSPILGAAILFLLFVYLDAKCIVFWMGCKNKSIDSL